MKKLQPRKKLTVPTETLRSLEASELKQIVGGVGASHMQYSCTPGCGTVSNVSFDC